MEPEIRISPGGRSVSALFKGRQFLCPDSGRISASLPGEPGCGIWPDAGSEAVVCNQYAAYAYADGSGIFPDSHG